jgi:hypothetical protein
MEVEKNRVTENGINFLNSRIENANGEDSLKTESINSENSTSSQNYSNLEAQNFDIQSSSNLQNYHNLCSSKRRKNLHSNFLLLKKKLNLDQFMRKTQIDSLLKKCKSKAFKTIHEALKKCLNIKLPRLPQGFITNIKIDFNKIYLDKTIYDIYNEYNIITTVEDFIEKNYLLEDKVNLFKDFISLTFRNVFEYYINSKQYIKDYYHIHQREGEKFAILFNYISKVFIQYYTKSKGNKPKKIKHFENGLQNNSNSLNNLPQILKRRKPEIKRRSLKLRKIFIMRRKVKVCEVKHSRPIFNIQKVSNKN